MTIFPQEVLPANVTGNRVAHPKRWNVAQVHNYCKRHVAPKNHSIALEAFVPIQKETHHWSDRDKVIDRIAIPLVVFVNTTDDDIKPVKGLSFVYKLSAEP